MAPKAIVTGSDSGIGRATALALARDGFDVGVTWHEDEQGAGDTAREVERQGVRAEIAQVDLSRPAAAADSVAELANRLGGIDVLVNNAGVGGMHSFLEYPLEEFSQIVQLNVTGTFACAQRAARMMADAARGGTIVNVTSVHEHVPLGGSAAYCAAKGGLGLLTKVMALELAEHGITVNAVAPGEIATAMTGNEDVDPQTVERPVIPAGRPGHANEIAAMIAFLAGPESRYTTGSSFVIDGGLTLVAAAANASSS